MPRRFARVRLSAVVVAALALGGCLLLTPLDDFEKGTGSEAGRGGGGSGRGGGSGTSASGEGGVPVGAGQAGESTSAGAGGDDGGDAGASGAPAGGSAGAPPTGCRSNAECITNGANDPYRCRPDGECARLKTSECPLVYGDVQSRNAIYIGSFAPLPDDRPDNSTVVYAERLALDEINSDQFGGLPDAEGISHPIVMVVCDNSGEPATLQDQIVAGMGHLANTVQVPAVLAMLLPGDMREVFKEYGAHEIFYLNPVGATRQIVELPDNDLIWNLLGQPSDLAPVYGELVRLLELHIRAERALLDEEPIRVALVTTTDAFNSELAGYVEDELEFNSMNADENEAAGNYRNFSVQVTNPIAGRTASAIGDAVREFRPDLVISAAGKEFTQTQGVLDGVELYWDGIEDPPPRPFHLLSPFNAGDIDAIRGLINAELGGPDPLANQRFVGIAAAGAVDKTLQNKYGNRLQDAFGNVSTDTGNYYDAFYYLAYATYSAMHTAESFPHLTGPDILRGFNLLLSGRARDVGPDDMGHVFTDLKQNSIELIGTLGPPDFDHAGGIRVDPGAVFCFENTGGMVTPLVDVLRYDRGNDEFTGEFPCFPNFPPSEP